MTHVPKYLVTKADGTPLPVGEPCFVLRGQDRLASYALLTYLLLARTHADLGSVTQAFVEAVNDHLVEFEAWTEKKWPD